MSGLPIAKKIWDVSQKMPIKKKRLLPLQNWDQGVTAAKENTIPF